MQDLRDRWLDYLSYCNDRRLDELANHVHDTIVFNDEPIVIADYAAAIAGNITAVPDYHWTVEDIAVDAVNDTVAVRLTDTGTPVREWLGIPPSGASFTIAEWAIYHYRDDKIAGMHFILDVPAAREQLSGPAPTPDPVTPCPSR